MKKVKGTALHIRGFPVKLHRDLSIKAAKERKSLKEVCIEILSKRVGK